jgi:hypothetical protein
MLDNMGGYHNTMYVQGDHQEKCFLIHWFHTVLVKRGRGLGQFNTRLAKTSFKIAVSVVKTFSEKLQ